MNEMQVWITGGMILLGENVNTYSKISSSATLSVIKPTWTGLELNPGEW